MTTHEILIAARDLISDPARWTQGACARDAKGQSVDILAPEATCFCASGAIGKVSDSIFDQTAFGKLSRACKRKFHRKVKKRLGATPVVFVNDHLGHAAILAAFDDAIARTAPDLGRAALLPADGGGG